MFTLRREQKKTTPEDTKCHSRLVTVYPRRCTVAKPGYRGQIVHEHAFMRLAKHREHSYTVIQHLLDECLEGGKVGQAFLFQ